MMRDLFRRAAGMIAAVAGASVLAVGVAAGPAGVAAAATTMNEVEAALPANAAANPNVILESLSCVSAGNCTAVGSYDDSSGYQQGLLLTETSGTWAAGVEAPLPANAAANPYVTLVSMSCASLGNCTAVGIYYTDSSGPYQQGLLLTETSGTWEAGVEAPLPANAATNMGDSVSSVSCVSAGNCTAVGAYADSSGLAQGLLLTETSGTWAAGVEAALPANAAPNQGDREAASLQAVSCVSAGNCTAVGFYYDTSGFLQGLLLTETSGTWAAGVQAALPANAAPDPVFDEAGEADQVSCASPGNCTADGLYYDTSGARQGLLLTETAGTWAAGVEAAQPANPAGFPGPGFSSLSCASAGNCTAVGFYEDGSGTDANPIYEGLMLTETAGTWAAGVAAPLPANAATRTDALVGSVSCASGGNCTATGVYEDSSGIFQGLLLTETSGTWATGAEVPAPANAAPNQGAGLGPVSCASPGNCTIVGDYTDSSGHQQGLLLSLTTQTQPTTTALVSSVNPSAAGQAVTYTATVSPAPDGGTVAFTDNGSPITGCGSQPVDTGSGAASCTTTPATAGAHNTVAAFSGSGGFTGSTSATLTQVVTVTPCQSLVGCNLSGASLTNAQLPGANLSGANLKGANLSGANLSGANMSGANLNKANLSGVNLSGANLSGANLNSANLPGANLSGADVAGANLGKVTWLNTTCPDGTNSNADGGTCTGHL